MGKPQPGFPMSENKQVFIEAASRLCLNLTQENLEQLGDLAVGIFEGVSGEPETETIVNGPEEAPTQDPKEELRGKSISSGSLLASDILPKFIATLKKYNPEEAKVYEQIDFNSIPEDKVGDLTEEIFKSMDTIAPEGCYFGANEGDGADFGFWPAD